jgi:hypothetical protein
MLAAGVVLTGLVMSGDRVFLPVYERAAALWSRSAPTSGDGAGSQAHPTGSAAVAEAADAALAGEGTPAAAPSGRWVGRDRFALGESAGLARGDPKEWDPEGLRHADGQPPSEDAADPDREAEEEPESLSISGIVSAESGEPVSRLDVTATLRRLFPDPGERRRPIGARHQRTSTDHLGFYEFRDLRDGEYAIQTEASERHSPAGIVVRAGVRGADLVVTDESELWLFGRAETGEGDPIAGVQVLPSGSGRVTTTGADGWYGTSLAVSSRKDYGIRFLSEDHRPEHLTVRGAEVSGRDEHRLDVRLEPIGERAEVRGIVTDGEGSAIAGAKIQLSSNRLGLGFHAVSNSTGEFRLLDVEVASDYALWARALDYDEHREQGLRVPPAGLTLSLTLEPSDRARLSGWMTSPEGSPLPGFSLWLRDAAGGHSRLVTSDGAGYFSVEDLPEGEVSLATGSSPRLSVSGIRLSAGAEERVRLPLDWGNHAIQGWVVDSHDEPVPASEVSVLWSLEEGGVRSRSIRRIVTGGSGEFLFTNLGSGLHTITVKAPDFPGARVEHQVGSGDDGILVQLLR